MVVKKSNLPAVPSQDDIQKQLQPYVDAQLLPIVIESDADYQAAGEALRDLKGEQKNLEAMRKSALAPIADLRSTVDGWFKPTLARYELHESALKAALRGYEQRREAERLQMEARLRDEHAREIAAALKEADALSQAGNDEQAEAILDLLPSPPVVISAQPKLAGIVNRQIWRGEVKDFTTFLLWCIDHDRLDLIQVNDQALQAFARSTKGTVPVEGATIWPETSTAARAS